MWNTGRKIIRLDDHSRTLMSIGIVALLGELNLHDPEGVPVAVGLKPFDTLTREQQVAAVYEVGYALLCDETAAPESALYRSATLQAVFRTLTSNLHREILENYTTVRGLALAAHRELFGEIEHGMTRDCPDMQQWNSLFKVIEKRFLDDRLLGVSKKITDLSPRVSECFFGMYGSDRNYFFAVPDDPTWPQAILLAARILAICKDRLVRTVYEKLQSEPLLVEILRDQEPL